MSAVPSRVQAYLDALIQMSADRDFKLVSVILFGSAATGGFSHVVSDVDLILVVADGANQHLKLQLREEVEKLELLHGLRDTSALPHSALDAFARRMTANVRSFFICTRSDLLSGSVARLLDIPRAQALFVDRGVIPGIIGSAVTIWGEDLLPHVPLPAIERFDVVKAFFGFCNQVLLSAALFPLLPSATRFAMGALKRSVHNCYFCYHLRLAPLDEEIDFFQRLMGPNRTLTQLTALRCEYRPSFAFVIRCLPTLVRLHLRTASDNVFPRNSVVARK